MKYLFVFQQQLFRWLSGGRFYSWRILDIGDPKETQNNQVLTIKGKGLPSFNRKRAGDLKCHIFVETPSSLSQEQEELLQQFQNFLSEAQLKKSSHWLDRLKKVYRWLMLNEGMFIHMIRQA